MKTKQFLSFIVASGMFFSASLLATEGQAKICQKPDGNHYGIADSDSCVKPNREVKQRPGSFLGLRPGAQMNYDAASEQAAAKTRKVEDTKKTIVQKLNSLQKQIDDFGNGVGEMWDKGFYYYAIAKDLEYIKSNSTKKPPQGLIDKYNKIYSTNFRAIESVITKEDLHKLNTMSMRMDELKRQWPVKGAYPPGFAPLPMPADVKPWLPRSIDRWNTKNSADSSKTASLKKEGKAPKAAAASNPSGEPVKYKFTVEEARSQYRTWYNLSKQGNSMNDFSTMTGVIEEMERKGFPVDAIKNDPQFRKRVANCYNKTGNAWC